MRVLLICPPYTQVYGKYKSAARMGIFYPPMGLMYLGAVLEEDKKEVRILDLELECFSKSELIKYIKDYNPSVIGIGSVTPLHGSAIGLFKLIKQIDNNIVTVSGGPHPTALPRKTMEETKEIDILCYGECEYTFRDLVRTLEKKGDLKEIKGIRQKNIALATAPMLITQLPKAKAAKEIQKLLQTLYGEGR